MLYKIHILHILILRFRLGPAINPIVQNDGDEPLPSLSDWHDYEPNLEFDDTELTHTATTNGKKKHFNEYAHAYVSPSYLFFFSQFFFGTNFPFLLLLHTLFHFLLLDCHEFFICESNPFSQPRYVQISVSLELTYLFPLCEM